MTDTIEPTETAEAAFAAALANFQARIPHIGKGNTAQVKSDKGNYCLDPDTRILLHNLTWVAASKLSEGDQILAFDEEPALGLRCRRYRRAEVEAVAQVALPSYRIHLDDGTTVIASDTHRWLTTRLGNQSLQWKDTRELKRSDRLVRVTDVWAEDLSREGGYVAGAFDGEGSLCQTSVRGRPASYQLHCTFAQRDNVMLSRVDAHLAHLGFAVQRSKPSGTNGDVQHLRIAGGRPEVLRFLGTVRPSRLLAMFDGDRLGTLYTKAAVGVERMEFLGVRDLIAMQTSTRTLIAEGLASHNSYSYADLTDITQVALPLLAECGLSWSAKTMVSPAGFLLLSSLRHRAGWVETSEWPLPDPTEATAQQVGSALTYARRYTFTALTGVAPGGEDDDAQAANSRAAADAPDPTAVAKGKVWEQAQRLGMDLPALKDRFSQDHGGELIDNAPAGILLAYAKTLAALGANGLPLNKDGSVSKRQSSEEERVAAGMMSAEEERAHKALAAETVANPKLAERSGGVPADEDPWSDVQVATPGSAA